MLRVRATPPHVGHPFFFAHLCLPLGGVRISCAPCSLRQARDEPAYYSSKGCTLILREAKNQSACRISTITTLHGEPGGWQGEQGGAGVFRASWTPHIATSAQRERAIITKWDLSPAGPGLDCPAETTATP